MVTPLTWTRPAAISASAWRRDATPAWARKRASRSPGVSIIAAGLHTGNSHSFWPDRLWCIYGAGPVEDRPARVPWIVVVVRSSYESLDSRPALDKLDRAGAPWQPGVHRFPSARPRLQRAGQYYTSVCQCAPGSG